jgi:cytoskeletal protein RodZ
MVLPPTPPGSLGSRLREARERRGLTVRQIASATKISVTALEALERNDLTRLPGGISGRAFIRSFASQVGLDPEQILQEFIEQYARPAQAGAPRIAPLAVEDHEAIESDRRIASALLRIVIASAVALGLMLFFGAC